MELGSRRGVLGALWLAVVLPAVLLPVERSEERALRKEPVVVAYASDAHGFPALLHSMLSLARHLEEPQQCIIHIIVPREDLARAQELLGCWRGELEALGRRAPAAELHELRPLGRLNVTKLWRQRRRSDVSVAANLARNYLPDYLPDAPRVLWLDIDTIVQADIAALFRTPMEHSIAAVVETHLGIFATYELAPPALKRWFEHEMAVWSYFNPGVLLIDLQRWREENVTSKVMDLVQLFQGWLIDTMALNVLFVDKFDLLNIEWNFQSLCTDTNWSEYGLSMRMAKILHWHGGWKPWDSGRPKEYAVNDHFYRAYDCRRPCGGLC